MRIDVVSGSRADYGPLLPVVDALRAAGHDVQFKSDDLTCSTDVVEAILWTAGCMTSEAVDHTSVPDLVLLLGDRYEVLGTAVGYYLAGVPIAHLSGGDLTTGSADDSMRHAITKLSHLHFVTNVDSAARVIQMGENPSRVHVVGCPGIDRIYQLTLRPSREVLLDLFGSRPPERYLLVCYHPDTSGEGKTLMEVEQLGRAIRWATGNCCLGSVIIGPCHDLGWQQVEQEWEVQHDPQNGVVFARELSQVDYLSLMRNAVALVGNSSAGFYEAPCFGTPVVNVGNRQGGRIPTDQLIQVSAAHVRAGIEWARFRVREKMAHPYGDGHAAERIAKIISSVGDPRQLLQKTFFSGENPWQQTRGGSRPMPQVTWEDIPQSTSFDGSNATSRGGRPGAPLDF